MALVPGAKGKLESLFDDEFKANMEEFETFKDCLDPEVAVQRAKVIAKYPGGGKEFYAALASGPIEALEPELEGKLIALLAEIIQHNFQKQRKF